MKGILLAGGTGSRLWPNTKAVSKQLLPVYDKPLIYYSLSTLLLAGIREILVITTEPDQELFRRLLGDGADIGITLQYVIQTVPDGIASALLLGEDFLANDSVCLVLGDNIFYGAGFGLSLAECTTPIGAIAFGFSVRDPKRYGVVELDEFGKPISIEEKPESPKSNFAIPGLYFFDNSAIHRVKIIEKSPRGEYEITSLLDSYLEDDKLDIRIFSRGTAWLDCGTTESMQDAATYVRVIEQRQGLKIGCIEEIAWRQGWIDDGKLALIASSYENSDYGNYLKRLI